MALALTAAEKQLARERAAELLAEDAAIARRLVELNADIAAFQPLEDLNTKIYADVDAEVGVYEAERRAIDGRYLAAPVTAAVMDQAARATGPLFPEEYPGLSPVRVVDLDGGTGHDPANELDGLATELAAGTALAALPVGDRPGAPEAQTLGDALATERAALQQQLAALAANPEAGPGSGPHAAAQGAFDQVEAFLTHPDWTDPGLTARRTQAETRQGFLQTTRLPAVAAALAPRYDERVIWLDARVHRVFGTRTRLVALQDEAAEWTAQRAAHAALAARYAALGAEP